MGRPPLPIGTYGSIRYYRTSTGWRATTNFRDFDGRTRPVERKGNTKSFRNRLEPQFSHLTEPGLRADLIAARVRTRSKRLFQRAISSGCR
jgi:hypothetical protein